MDQVPLLDGDSAARRSTGALEGKCMRWRVVGRWALAVVVAPVFWALLEWLATIMLRGINGLVAGGILRHPLIDRIAQIVATTGASLLLGVPVALLARRVIPSRAFAWCFVVAALPVAYQLLQMFCSTCGFVWGPYPSTVTDYFEVAGTYAGIALGPMVTCLLLQRYCPLTTRSSGR